MSKANNYTVADVGAAADALWDYDRRRHVPRGSTRMAESARTALDAVAPAIAARALREAATAYHAARTASPSSVQYLQPETFLLDRANEIEAGR